jgi:hypothetical protein
MLHGGWGAAQERMCRMSRGCCSGCNDAEVPQHGETHGADAFILQGAPHPPRLPAGSCSLPTLSSPCTACALHCSKGFTPCGRSGLQLVGVAREAWRRALPHRAPSRRLALKLREPRVRGLVGILAEAARTAGVGGRGAAWGVRHMRRGCPARVRPSLPLSPGAASLVGTAPHVAVVYEVVAAQDEAEGVAGGTQGAQGWAGAPVCMPAAQRP